MGNKQCSSAGYQNKAHSVTLLQFGGSYLKKVQSFEQLKGDKVNHRARWVRNYELTYNEWDAASLDPVGLTQKYFDYEKGKGRRKKFEDWAGTDGASLVEEKHSDYDKEMLELRKQLENRCKDKYYNIILLPFNSTASQIFTKLTPTDQQALRKEFERYWVFELTKTDEVPGEQLGEDEFDAFLERVEGRTMEEMTQDIKGFLSWAGIDEGVSKKTLSKRQKREDYIRKILMSSKYMVVATAIFMTPIRFFGPGDPKQMDLTQDTTSLDTAGLTLGEFLKVKCKHGSDTLIQDLPANKVQSIQIQPNASGSGSVILFNGQDIGPTICISVGDNREFLIRPLNGDGSSFIKLEGHVVTKTKEGVIEMMWGDSNIGDSGAKYEQNFILELFVGKSNVTNTRVNFDKPVAKQRGSELVLIDVTSLQLDGTDVKEFSIALAKYYESNFWIKFKTISLTVWITTVAAVSTIKFRSYTKRERATNHWKSRVFLVLELVDQAKDLVFLYTKRHSLWMSLVFSQTMIVPFIVNVWATNVVQLRVNQPLKKEIHDKPKEVKEVKLLARTTRTHFGFEKKEERTDDKSDDAIADDAIADDAVADPDFAQRRYEGGKNTKWIENLGQMMSILIESFLNADTITFPAMFNLIFGLLMSTLTFAEHAGHKFAAKHPYRFKNEITEDTIAVNQDGMTEHEKECQRLIRKYFVAKSIQQIGDLDPQEWRQWNRRGLDKLFHKQIYSVFFNKAIDEKQLKKLLFNKSYEDFTLQQRIQNGLLEMYSTIGVTLCMFTTIFYIYLEPRSAVQELEVAGLIENIRELEDSAFPFVAINDNMATIVATIFALPVIVYAFTQFSKVKAKKTSSLEAPLLGNESVSKSGIEPSQQVSDKSILIRFTEGVGKLHSSPLVVKDTIHQITVSSQWVGDGIGRILLILERDGEEIASQDLFGQFDSSLNQTDTVLTSESDIVKQAQPGDHYFLKADGFPYIWSLRLELLGKEEEAKGLFVYKCPKAHQLKVYYADDHGRKTNTQWKELTRAKNEHGCGHVRKIVNENTYPVIPFCQYFCDDCAESYCGDCALKHRVANKDFNWEDQPEDEFDNSSLSSVYKRQIFPR